MSDLFVETLAPYELDFAPRCVETLQMNITRLCNQACAHCHVDASRMRTEMMAPEVMDRCVGIVASNPCIAVVDITGGAPELHPRFEHLVERMRALGRRVLVRHNLTVTLDPHPVMGTTLQHLPALFARHGVEVLASLPCYTKPGTDGQRGAGVFEKSITSLRLLNAEGFGMPGSGLVLDLVSNPVGAYLPGPQHALEAEFRTELRDAYGVHFNRLLAIANMPISRFADQLDASGIRADYLGELASRCNPAAAEAAMCRSMVSVGYDGTLYDCDFNQMLGLSISGPGRPLTVYEFEAPRLLEREIRWAEHCLGCTAGAGSSCGGATT